MARHTLVLERASIHNSWYLDRVDRYPLVDFDDSSPFSRLRFSLSTKKRKILDGYISKAQIRRQFLLRIGSHVLLYAILTIVIIQTIEEPFWQMLVAIFAILTPLYFISEWIIRRDGARDPDYISDVEVARFVRQKGTSKWNTYSSDKHV